MKVEEINVGGYHRAMDFYIDELNKAKQRIRELEEGINKYMVINWGADWKEYGKHQNLSDEGNDLYELLEEDK